MHTSSLPLYVRPLAIAWALSVPVAHAHPLSTSDSYVTPPAGQSLKNAEPMGEGGEGEEAAIALAPFVANLRGDDDDVKHYLKCSLTVALKNPKNAKEFQAAVPKIRNSVLIYLRGLRSGDTDGSENMKKIGERLTKEIGEAAGHDLVSEVYITEFLVQ